MIIIRKSKNENLGKKVAKDLHSILFSQRIYTDLLIISYKTETINSEFSCGYIPEFDLKRFGLSNQFDKLRYKELWMDEHEKLARVFLDILRDVPVEVYNFPRYQEYIELYLSVYLHRACWIAAQKFDKKRGIFFRRDYDICDYHIIALEKIQDKKKLFKNFCFESNYRVESYTIKKLLTQIRDEVIKENPHLKKSKYKEYGLLRNISKKNDLEPALKSIGLPAREIEQIILVWRCFKKIYSPQSKSGQRLPQPTSEDCINIARLYNRKCDCLVYNRENITPEEIIPCLEECIKALEEWSKVSIIYPDRNSTSRESSGEWEKVEQDYFSRNINSSSDNSVESILSILDRAFAKLSAYEQGILTVIEFGLQATQTEIGIYLGVHQATIARRRDKILQKLYLSFIELWNTTNFDLEIQKSNASLAILKKYLSERLTDLCFFRVDAFFEDKRKSLKRTEKEILKSCYKRIKQNVVSASDSLANQQECDRLKEMFKKKVLECLYDDFKDDFKISLESLEPLLPKIDPFFQRWLCSLTDLD